MNNIAEVYSLYTTYYYGANYDMLVILRNKNNRYVQFISHSCSNSRVYVDHGDINYKYAQTPIKCTFKTCQGLSNVFIIDSNTTYRTKLKEFMIYNSNKYSIILLIPGLLPELLEYIRRGFFYVLLNKID